MVCEEVSPHISSFPSADILLDECCPFSAEPRKSPENPQSSQSSAILSLALLVPEEQVPLFHIHLRYVTSGFGQEVSPQESVLWSYAVMRLRTPGSVIPVLLDLDASVSLTCPLHALASPPDQYFSPFPSLQDQKLAFTVSLPPAFPYYYSPMSFSSGAFIQSF